MGPRRAKKIGRYYRLNLNINAKTLRLIDQSGKQVGIVSIEEARKKSAEADLDLVEISPKADPPVAKIVDFKKFKYEEAKKERAARKKVRRTGTKEIWLGPLMSDHDLEVRLNRAREFLTIGDRVKLTVKFGGREITHPEFGHKVLNTAAEKLTDISERDSEPKLMGRRLTMSLKPTKGNKNEDKNQKDGR